MFQDYAQSFADEGATVQRSAGAYDVSLPGRLQADVDASDGAGQGIADAGPLWPARMRKQANTIAVTLECNHALLLKYVNTAPLAAACDSHRVDTSKIYFCVVPCSLSAVAASTSEPYKTMYKTNRVLRASSCRG